MTDQIREQVSALLDGELPRDEIGLLVRRMERDLELRGSFGRYSLIGETLRAPGGRTAHPSFAARVSAAIDAPGEGAEPEILPVAASLAVWKRPAFATAVAAGFALLAVILVRPFASEETVVVAANTAAALKGSPLAGAVSPTPAQSQRLAGYLVAHSQFSSPMARRSVWSGLLAADPGLQRVSFEIQEAP
jgi:negative regulator of sigma E activity